jgi:hypothetical protein
MLVASHQSEPSALLDLAPGGVCRAGDITATAGGLLHHRFTLADQGNTPCSAIYLSVALSVGLPRPAVSRHRALWSADFPRREKAETCLVKPRSPSQLDRMMVALAQTRVKRFYC